LYRNVTKKTSLFVAFTGNMMSGQKGVIPPSGGINSLFYFAGTNPGSSGQMITRKITGLRLCSGS